MPTRDYESVLSRIRPATSGEDRDAAMRRVADALWEALGGTGVSWLGFYTKPDGRDEMILGPRRDKPACSPIGLHGMCGRAFLARRPLVLKDAAALDPAAYIACDPRDRAEVVVPLFNPDGACWGVLDLDSYDPDAFDETDAAWLARILEAAGLSAPRTPAPAVMRF